MNNTHLLQALLLICLLSVLDSLYSQNYEIPAIPSPTLPIEECKERVLSQCDIAAYAQLSLYKDFVEPESFCYKIFMANHCGLEHAYGDIMMSIASIISDVDYRTRTFLNPYVNHCIETNFWIVRALVKQNPDALCVDSMKMHQVPSREFCTFSNIQECKSCVLKRGSLPAYEELRKIYSNNSYYCELLYYALVMSGVFGYEPAARDVNDIMCELCESHSEDNETDSISVMQMALYY